MNSMQSSPTVCESCGATQSLSLIIHLVRHRASNRRLCTNCVLKHHRGHFCPICFEVFDDPLPPHHRLVCVRCPTIAHRSCFFPSSSDSAATPPAFQCRTCLDPNFSYFNLPDRKSGSIDVHSAKVLVAAAKIAAISMSKAAAVARLDAECRAKEAAFARKRAREALERLADIIAKEQEALAEKRTVSAKKAGLRVT